MSSCATAHSMRATISISSKFRNFQRNNFGGSLGGPIRHDKVFLFGNYEGYRQNLGLSNVALVPDANARQGFLPIGPGGSLVDVGLAPGVPDLLQLWPTPNGPELTDPTTGKPTGIARAFSSPKQTIREDFGTVRSDYQSRREGPPLWCLHHRRLHRPHPYRQPALGD